MADLIDRKSGRYRSTATVPQLSTLFDRYIKTDVSAALIDMNQIVEISERRNCIVHAGGIVHQALADASSHGPLQLNVGETLVETIEATQRHLGIVERCGMSVVLCILDLFAQRAGYGEQYLTYVVKRSFNALRREDYELTIHIYEVVSTLRGPKKESFELYVNAELARRKLGLPPRGWDSTETLNDIQRMAVALLGPSENHEKVARVKRLIESHDITLAELLFWPLFEDCLSSTQH